MRIVAGQFGGRRLRSPGDARIRPTIDRVREAVFSIIAPHVPGARVLDLFAGTGAFGLEALSRGASRAVFVDQSRDAVRIIEENISRCGVQDRARVILAPVRKALLRLAEEGGSFDLVFMDPPYGKGCLEASLPHLGEVTHSDSLVIGEHHAKDVLPTTPQEGWVKTEERRYGDTRISFFVRDVPR